MSNLELANNRILEILSRNGITSDKPFELYKEAEAIAKEKQNSKDLITIADRYTDLLDLKPKQQQQMQQTEQISYTKMLENGEKAKITAKREIKSIENGENLRINTSEVLENSLNIDSEVPTNDNTSDI